MIPEGEDLVHFTHRAGGSTHPAKQDPGRIGGKQIVAAPTHGSTGNVYLKSPATGPTQFRGKGTAREPPPSGSGRIVAGRPVLPRNLTSVNRNHPALLSKGRFAVAVAAIGVVYGDIGTSPLYVVRESLRDVVSTEETILGIASLLFWTLTLLVSLKYVTFLLNATSHGEGGIFALLALSRQSNTSGSALMLGAAMCGAALLYGDGVITPAISVLSAVEGLVQLSPDWSAAVLPVTCTIIVILFLLQAMGSGRIGHHFGRVTVIWFLAIGSVGAWQVLESPGILKAINPVHAIRFLGSGEIRPLAVLGGVLLCITGAEELYADVGHFGKGAIRLSWWGLVKPTLLANYFGQLGWLLEHPSAGGVNPFYAIVPAGLVPVFVLLATLATVIASQALISGVFSLTEQGTQLGLLPQFRVIYTSSTRRGQIYLPTVNWLLMALCLALVLGFRNSGNLAGAYGLAVVAGMIITTLFFFNHVRRNMKWPLAACLAIAGVWLSIEVAFLFAGSVKFLSGAWIPALLTVTLFIIMQTWLHGSRMLQQIDLPHENLSLREILSDGGETPRIPGSTGVILSDYAIKPKLFDYVERFRALPEKVVLVTVDQEIEARVPEDERYRLQEIETGVHSLRVRKGFAEQPDIRAALNWARGEGCEVDADTATYFVFRRILVPLPKAAPDCPLPYWRRALFAFLHRQMVPWWVALKVPEDRIVEISVHESL